MPGCSTQRQPTLVSSTTEPPLGAYATRRGAPGASARWRRAPDTASYSTSARLLAASRRCLAGCQASSTEPWPWPCSGGRGVAVAAAAGEQRRRRRAGRQPVGAAAPTATGDRQHHLKGGIQRRGGLQVSKVGQDSHFLHCSGLCRLPGRGGSSAHADLSRRHRQEAERRRCARNWPVPLQQLASPASEEDGERAMIGTRSMSAALSGRAFHSAARARARSAAPPCPGPSPPLLGWLLWSQSVTGVGSCRAEYHK